MAWAGALNATIFPTHEPKFGLPHEFALRCRWQIPVWWVPNTSRRIGSKWIHKSHSRKGRNGIGLMRCGKFLLCDWIQIESNDRLMRTRSHLRLNLICHSLIRNGLHSTIYYRSCGKPSKRFISQLISRPFEANAANVKRQCVCAVSSNTLSKLFAGCFSNFSANCRLHHVAGAFFK